MNNCYKKIIESHSRSEFYQLENYWNEAIEKCNGASPFLSYEWFLTFVNTIPDIRNMLVLLSCNSNGAHSIFPGMLEKSVIHKISFDSIQFISNFYSPYCSIVNFSNDAGVENIFKRIANLQNWDILILADIRENTGEYKNYCRVLKSLNMNYKLFKREENWFLPCNSLSFEKYLATRSKKRRKKILYEKRRLEGMQGYFYSLFIDNNNRLEQVIDEYFEVYESSWKNKEPYPDFHRNLIRSAANQGWLRLGVIKIDEKPIAAQIWLVYKKTASILKVAYDDKFSKYSPGTVLTLNMIEHVLDNDQVDEIDFLKGGDKYKAQWMTDCRDLKTIIAYNRNSLKGSLLYHFDHYIYPGINSIKKIFQKNT